MTGTAGDGVPILPDPSEPTGLGRTAGRAALWVTAESWIARGLGIVVFTILTRSLAPRDFGQISLALAVTSFGALFLEHGMSQALIQKEPLEPEDIDAAFWAAVATSGLLTITFLLLAPVMANAIGAPGITPLLRLFAVTFVINATQTAPSALLMRSFQYRTLAIRRVLASVLSGTVAAAIAVTTHSIAALVVQTLLSAVTSAAVLWRSVDWRPGWRFSWSRFKRLFGFGINITGTNTLFFLQQQSDKLIIGAVRGTVALGVYSVGARLYGFVLELLTGAISAVSLTAFSRLQQDLPRLRRAYVSVQRVSAFVAAPAFLGLAALAPQIVPVVLGPRWAGSVPVVSAFAVTGLSLALVAYDHSLLLSLGQARRELLVSLFQTVVLVTAIAVSAPFGIAAVARAIAVASVAIMLNRVRIACALLHLDWKSYGRAVVGAVLAGGVASAIAAAVASEASGREPTVGSLALGVAVLGCTYGVLVLLVARPAAREAIGAVATVLRRGSADSS